VNALNQRLRETAAETITIVAQGGYRAASGAWVDIADAVGNAVAGTRLHLPDEPLPGRGAANPARLVEVTPESTLAAARRLGDGTAALVFASARNPGGGFRTGARAQEEDIARCSALHACLDTVPAFYAYHRAEPDLRYSDRIIYSPHVPVFRDDSGRLLDRPHHAALITAAAPNVRAVVENRRTWPPRSPPCWPAGRYAYCRSPPRTDTAGWSSAPGAAAYSATIPTSSRRRSRSHWIESIASTTWSSPCSTGHPQHRPTVRSPTLSGPCSGVMAATCSCRGAGVLLCWYS
jgi:hypothetical protein